LPLSDQSGLRETAGVGGEGVWAALLRRLGSVARESSAPITTMTVSIHEVVRLARTR
jgi:hypothetical protein